MTEPIKPPTANEITAELLIQIPKTVPGALCWRQNAGKGIGWGQVKAIRACLMRGDCKGALKFLSRPMSFGLPGSADVVILAGPPLRFIGCEIKADYDDRNRGDVQSPVQEAWAARVRSLGGEYFLVEHIGWDRGKPDISDVLEKLREACG